jgi:hypothetical protein
MVFGILKFHQTARNRIHLYFTSLWIGEAYPVYY